MTAATDFLEDALLKHVLNSVNYADPVSVYVALFTTATTDAGGGTEVSGGGYARQIMTGGWTIASGVAQNTADVNFGTATANWGTITHVAIFDALTGGNMLIHGPLDASVTVNNGDSFKFAATDLKVSLD